MTCSVLQPLGVTDRANGIVKDTWAGDLALIELHRDGSTGGPADVVRELAARGHVTLNGPAAALTAGGRDRARRLKDSEGNLRQLFASGRPTAINGVHGSSLHG